MLYERSVLPFGDSECIRHLVITCINSRKREYFSSRELELWPTTSIFELDLDRIKMNRQTVVRTLRTGADVRFRKQRARM